MKSAIRAVLFTKTKRQRFLERNTREQGVRLKYALGIERQSGKVFALNGAENIPVFYLALPEEHLKTAEAQFSSSMEQSSFERKLFSYFVAALDLQVRDLELKSGRLAPALKNRLENFRDCLKSRFG